MEQRRLRLGDILDDYCPRERRVTNHAVVAMIEEDVKQTRCTTCDAEHAYKGARVPKRRKKETPAALYKEVLAGMPEAEEAPLPAAAPPVPAAVVAAQVEEDVVMARSEEPSTPPPTPDYGETGDDPGDVPVADGPVHRRLIRATLPRIEGQKEARPVPDFTARQVPTRGTGQGFRGDRMRMRGGGGHGTGSGNGNAYGPAGGNRGGGSPRFQGNRQPGQGRAGNQGFRNGNGHGNGTGSGNKRGRGSR